MKSKILIIAFLFISLSSYAQNELNGYRYVIVPKKFDFQKVEDKYQLNSLTKFLFKKEGFSTTFDSEKVSQDMYDNPCLGLRANVLDKSGMLSTKLTIELKNCNDDTVFTSAEGKSKLKEYKKGYQEALRKAFESVKALDYKFDASLVSLVKPKVDKVEPLVDSQPEIETVVENQAKKEVIKSVEQPIEIIEEASEEAMTVEKNEPNSSAASQIIKDSDILYAQVKPFGFQLVDSAPRVVYLLQKTSIVDIYVLKNKNGIIHKKNDKWIAEYYENDKLVQKELNIKF